MLGPDRSVVPNRFAHLYAVAPKLPTRHGVAFPSSDAGAAESSPAKTARRDAADVLREITAAWPRPMAVAELAQMFGERGARDPGDATVPQHLAELLLAAFGAGAIELHSHVPTLAAAAGELPTASALARAQARYSDRVTNLWHETVALDEPLVRQLVPLLDGTRDRIALRMELGPGLHGASDSTPEERLEVRHHRALAVGTCDGDDRKRGGGDAELGGDAADALEAHVDALRVHRLLQREPLGEGTHRMR